MIGRSGGELVEVTKGEELAGREMGWDHPAKVLAVHDYFVWGDVCEENGRHRKTRVSFMCCGNEGKTELEEEARTVANVVSLQEVSLCQYQINICTSLLCAPQMESPSVMGLLAAMPPCLPALKENWWSYQLCHGEGIRQYKAGVKVDKYGETSPVIEAEYSLGRFDPTKLPEDEGELLRRAWDREEISIVLEYTGGTECPLAGVHRAATVELTCGPRDSFVKITEDRTCHYIIQATSPILCRHPALATPPPPTRVVECLPEAVASSQAEDPSVAAE
ncbi:unnamed protein product [Discosporangium mesarthrocarpum]